MDTSEQFLDLYRDLEMAGRVNYFPNLPANENVIGRMLTLPQLKQYKEELNYCRVVRNFLVHNPRIDGRYGVQPSKEMIHLMTTIIQAINQPMKALDAATAARNLLKAHLDTNVLELIKKMRARAITHVPVTEHGKLVGIFSEDTIFSHMVQADKIVVDGNTRVGFFADYLPPDKHVSEYFEFVNASTLLAQVEDLFNRHHQDNRLLSAVFITQDGRKNQPILGMLTPWDVIKGADD